MSQATPTRRFFQFGMGTMLAVVSVVTLPAAWVGYDLSWIRQRQELLAKNGALLESSGMNTMFWTCHHNRQYFIEPPSSLGLFGERGVAWIDLVLKADKRPFIAGAAPAEATAAKQLFPEAKISWTYLPRSNWIDDMIKQPYGVGRTQGPSS